jgi:flagellar hook protein FlgE
MAIQGDGYFVMSGGKQNFFSRDGAFDLGRPRLDSQER